MRVLVACEESQRVCKEFRKRGHEAYSCDLLPAGGGHPEWHIQADVLEIVKMEWDMVLAFPPCTHLAVSGARHFEEKKRNGKQQMGIGFFLSFTALDHVPKVVIENPIGIMSNLYRKPDQIIQPYWFGDPIRKSTCLWLKGVGQLEKTNVVEPEIINYKDTSYSGPAYYVKDEEGKILSWKDPRTAIARSKTYPGVAKAMADQWG